ncbi:type IV pilus modification PilV family protein [Bdellovibrio sp. HCB337]|uniref:type IV pilus modification PilV family protein n=1 Tax=Bdellovibrio sp. HCB337 TaxID=3394358 RepID=UPI0039A5225D
MGPTRLRHQRGYSLLETMVSIGIMVGLTVIISPFIVRQFAEFEAEKISVTRILLQMQTERYLSNPKLKGFIQTTLNENPNLKNCVTKTGGCQSVTDLGFNLYDNADMLLAGGPTNPARFDVTGAPCVGGPRCLFQVAVTYTATCVQGASTCFEPAAVTASYTIQQNPDAIAYKGPAMKTIVSAPIPIHLRHDTVPPFRVTRYTSGGNLGVHEFCMIQSLNPQACALTGSYKQNWYSSGSCASAVCFDFL